MIRPRFRMMYKFWLDVTKPDESALSELIDDLKADHLFTRTIRDGLRLIHSLRQGRVDVLLELFPFVANEFQPQIIVPDNSQLYQEIGDIKRLIESELVTANPTLNGSKGPKPISVPQFEVPAFDDEDKPELTIKKDTSVKSAENFLQSMMSLQQAG